MKDVRRWLDDLLVRWNVSQAVRNDLALAVTELCTNIIRHGYRGRTGSIEISIERRGDTIRIIVVDQAPVFVPPARRKLPSPQRLAEGGYGLALVKAVVDKVTHQALGERGNRIILTKREPSPP